ncbi:MAG TPA: hypothetical protein PLY23_06050 [Alphaproteobacteria bacterium]|nr:hypothetical protein [Alphaproteobacteria bacterium]HQS94246.1 hypothetical protein [Alphaproteobacteria bacterium]
MKLKNKGLSLFVLYVMGGILLTSIEGVDADGGLDDVIKFKIKSRFVSAKGDTT